MPVYQSTPEVGRARSIVGGTTRTYTSGPTGLGTVIAEGTVENVFGPAGLAEQVDDSSQTAQFAGADALGSIRLITDGSGTVVGTGSCSPWGVPDSGSVTLNGFGFTGEHLDPESGFVYLRHRYLDPATSRFLTPDPLGALGSGVNLYAYVGNNPATLTDPNGLACNLCGELPPPARRATISTPTRLTIPPRGRIWAGMLCWPVPLGDRPRWSPDRWWWRRPCRSPTGQRRS